MPRPRSFIWAFVPVAAVYLYFFPYFEKINNPNENVRLYLVKAIVDQHSLRIDVPVREWGYVNDRSTFQNHQYSAKAPGTSLSGVPVYWLEQRLFKALGWSLTRPRIAYALRLFAVVLPVLGFLWAFGRFLERRGATPHARDVAVIGLGLGTPLLAYGTVFVAHAQVAACACGGFMLVRRAADLDWEGLAPARAVAWRLAAGGLLAGWAVLTEYQVLIVAAVLTAHGAAVLRHRRRLGWFLAGAVPAAVLLLGYNYFCFGGCFEFSYHHLENAEFAHNTKQGFLGFADIKLATIGAALFGRQNGLFFFSPLCALGLCGAGLALGRRGARADAVCVLAAVVLPVLHLGGLVAWRAGWSIGPRYITVVMPFLAYGVVLLLAPARGRRLTLALSAAAAALALAGVVIAGVAVVYPHYPQEFKNPTFELAWKLVREGFLPYSFGGLVGLRGLKAAWPLAPFLLVAAGLLLVGDGGWSRRELGWRLGHAAAAAALLGALLGVARLGLDSDPARSRIAQSVRLKWEPTEGLPRVAPLRPLRPPRPPPRPAPPPVARGVRLRAPAAPPPARRPPLGPGGAALQLEPRVLGAIMRVPLWRAPATRAPRLAAPRPAPRLAPERR